MKNKMTILQLLFVLFLYAPIMHAQKTVDQIFIKSTTQIISLNDENLSTKSTRFNRSLDLGEYGVYDLQLEQTYLFSDSYVARRAKKNSGKSKLPLTFKGTIQGQPNTKVSLTTNDNFLSGFIDTGEEVIFFEPYKNFDTNAVENELIIYYQKDVIDQGHTCAANHTNKQAAQVESHNNQSKSMNTCSYVVEMVLVADYGMYQKHSITNISTLNHMTTVLTNVATNYDNEFNDPITFTVVDSYIATNSAMDLWSDTADASALLAEFKNSNFTTDVYDLASLWVTRNIWSLDDQGDNNPDNDVKNYSTVGVAYTPGVCDSRYNLIEDYSSNAADLRVTLAHEIGHNFGAGHDVGNSTIMAENVNNTTTWSQQSQNDINAFYPTANCLCALGDRADLAFYSCGSENINGDVLSISGVQVINEGTIASEAFKVGWYLSSDNNITTNDELIISYSTTPLAAGFYRTFNNPIVADLSNVNVPSGNYYLGAIVDYENAVAEFREDNNIDCISSSADITIPGAACVTNYTVPANHTSNEYIEASNKITSQKIVPNGRTITYDAGVRVHLKNGFHAQSGSTFRAKIDGCSANKEEIVDNEPTLIRNYPNPFTGQTTIEFKLPKDTPVTLFVSDLTGKKISVLLNNDERTEGTHTITFDGNNYPAGMYYYTIQAGEYYDTQKMILAK